MAGITVGVARETASGERRVALTPETCKKLIARGARVLVQRGAGESSAFTDQAYAEAGASIRDDPGAALSSADLVLCVQPPMPDALRRLREGAAVVGLLAPQA